MIHALLFTFFRKLQKLAFDVLFTKDDHGKVAQLVTFRRVVQSSC